MNDKDHDIVGQGNGTLDNAGGDSDQSDEPNDEDIRDFLSSMPLRQRMGGFSMVSPDDEQTDSKTAVIDEWDDDDDLGYTIVQLSEDQFLEIEEVKERRTFVNAIVTVIVVLVF